MIEKYGVKSGLESMEEVHFKYIKFPVWIMLHEHFTWTVDTKQSGEPVDIYCLIIIYRVFNRLLPRQRS